MLERAATPIGVVQAINGRTVFDIAISGRQAHAGTTPMELRTDALVSAARVILAVEAIARDRRLCAVSTVGKAVVTPDEANVIPGQVQLTAQIRDPDTERLARAEAAIRHELDLIQAYAGSSIRTTVGLRTKPVATHETIRASIRQATAGLGLGHMPIVSGAGHDAQIIAEVAPIGMIFVPSRHGISHAPEEHTDDTDLINGANVLLHTAIALVTTGTTPD